MIFKVHVRFWAVGGPQILPIEHHRVAPMSTTFELLTLIDQISRVPTPAEGAYDRKYDCFYFIKFYPHLERIAKIYQ